MADLRVRLFCSLGRARTGRRRARPARLPARGRQPGVVRGGGSDRAPAPLRGVGRGRVRAAGDARV